MDSEGPNTSPPAMAGWNLALRFGLEIAAIVGLGGAAWSLNSGATRWLVVFAVPIAAEVVWAVFNVPDDPSRSGKAPVAVAGWIRLSIELIILFGAAIAFGTAVNGIVGIGLALLIAFHYGASIRRVRWLLIQ